MDEGLNTIEIYTALNNEPNTEKCLTAVCSRTGLKDIKEKPKLVIVNTDPVWEPGTHWLLLYFNDSGVCEFFDSLGKDTADYHQEIENFMSLHTTKPYIKVNQYRIQPINTALCGHYCLWYAYGRCSGTSMKKLIDDIPSQHWIKCCIPLLFNIDRIECLYQCCCRFK